MNGRRPAAPAARAAPYAGTINRAYRVLVVCTANQCRSPMAAAILARSLANAGIHSEIYSAGTAAGPATPAAADAVAALRELGLDIEGHESRTLDPVAIASADLVLGMAREHAREAVTIAPMAFGRTFTLKELVRRGEASPRGAEDFADWLVKLASDRGVEDLLGTSPHDDIADPMGRSYGAFQKTVGELADLAERLVRVAWPRRV